MRDIAVQRGYGKTLVVDSAGTHAHVGARADSRSLALATARGYDLKAHRGRQLERADFVRFDLLLAMDEGHHRAMLVMATPEQAEKVQMFLGFARKSKIRAVPDPYYGGPAGFEEVLNLVEDGAEGLLDALHPRLL